MVVDLTQINIASLIAFIGGAVALIKGLEYLIDKINMYIRKQSKKDNEPIETNQKELHIAFTSVNGQLNELREIVSKHEESINAHDRLLGNDNEHLKRHDVQIADIQHRSEEDRYMNTKCFQVLIRNALGIASEEDLKKADNELNEYILGKAKN